MTAGPLSRRIAARRDPNAKVEPDRALRGPCEPTAPVPAWVRRASERRLPGKVLVG